jgi:NADPH-dependent F420 reductase
METQHRTIAILGGTGDLGRGLTRRWAQAGHHIIIGSREESKAAAALAELKAVLAERGETVDNALAMSNYEAAKAADIVVLTVPFAHQLNTLEPVKVLLQGKILLDVTVPLMPPKVAVVQLPPEGSAGQRAQQFLGDEVRVVSLFQNVAAHHLLENHKIDCDVLVTGNDKAAREEAIALVEAAGMTGYHAGPIANSVAAEALTSILININRQYKCHAGIVITGIK